MDEQLWRQFFGNKTLEEIQEENRLHDLKMIEENPPLTLSFGKFIKGDYQLGHRNLYIVWRGKQALYIGISRTDIWGRWFGRGGQSHMYFSQKYSGTLEGGRWQGLSPIGIVIVNNQPASMRWRIELRYVPFMDRWDLEEEEKKLIHEIHPLFNSAHLPELTKKEVRIYRRLTDVDQQAARAATRNAASLLHMPYKKRGA